MQALDEQKEIYLEWPYVSAGNLHVPIFTVIETRQCKTTTPEDNPYVHVCIHSYTHVYYLCYQVFEEKNQGLASYPGFQEPAWAQG